MDENKKFEENEEDNSRGLLMHLNNAKNTIKAMTSYAETFETCSNSLETCILSALEKERFMDELETPLEKRIQIIKKTLTDGLNYTLDFKKQRSLDLIKENLGLDIPKTIFEIEDDMLNELDFMEAGDTITCEECGEQHKVIPCKNEDGVKTNEVLICQCSESGNAKIVGYKGRDIRGLE